MKLGLSRFRNILPLLALLILGFSTISSAQSRGNDDSSRDDDDYEPEMTLRERIYLGTYVNTPSLYSNNLGSSIRVGLQPFAAYRFNKYMSSGLALKFDYLYLTDYTNTLSLTDFSATVFTRALLAECIILQVEGGLYNDQESLASNTKFRKTFPIALVGVGYSWGRSEILLAYELTGNFLSNGIFPFEYKFGFVFNL